VTKTLKTHFRPKDLTSDLAFRAIFSVDVKGKRAAVQKCFVMSHLLLNPPLQEAVRQPIAASQKKYVFYR
jgi:hypothetical protein